MHLIVVLKRGLSFQVDVDIKEEDTFYVFIYKIYSASRRPFIGDNLKFSVPGTPPLQPENYSDLVSKYFNIKEFKTMIITSF